ncbi:hypothetical protein Ahy_B08g090295 [Arachis hypogaea]|uniref:Transposase MuDR plant domain-containing protein n=1 Tax=Arachis hypogaea TaxID=3818 RepID=A0A444XZX5_ARAHY|nr:hypothetical protein Ahy_B08g090295 [Arachis hypogaea]
MIFFDDTDIKEGLEKSDRSLVERLLSDEMFSIRTIEPVMIAIWDFNGTLAHHEKERRWASLASSMAGFQNFLNEGRCQVTSRSCITIRGGKPDAGGGVSLKLLRLDRDMVNMYEDAIRNDYRVVHMYWEHAVDIPTEVEVVDVDAEKESREKQKNRRNSYKRAAPSGQAFVQGGKGEAPKISVPHTTNCDSDYEAERTVWPQGNPNVAFGSVHLELGIEFETMDQFKRAVRKFNIQIGRSIMFSRVEPMKCKLEEKLRDQRDFKTVEAEAWFRREFNVSINYKKIQRAMKKARRILRVRRGNSMLS